MSAANAKGVSLPRNPITGTGSCARRERPYRRAAEQSDELAPSDVACHVTLPWEVMPMEWETLPRFDYVVWGRFTL